MKLKKLSALLAAGLLSHRLFSNTGRSGKRSDSDAIFRRHNDACRDMEHRFQGASGHQGNVQHHS